MLLTAAAMMTAVSLAGCGTAAAAGSSASSAGSSAASAGTASAGSSPASAGTASGTSSAADSSYAGAPDASGIWMDSLTKYRTDDKVNHLIFVQWTKNSSDARVQVYEKDPSHNNSWTITLQCDAYVGKNGVKADKKEGDGATPSGDFGVLTAFGIKANPGTQLDWIDVTDSLWCPDSNVPDYNKIADASRGGTAEGEHLIEYSPQYNYAMFLDYNKECNPENGSAIFFHCIGPKTYTGGCVAVSEENMKYILQVFGKDDRVIIAPYLK
jgi:L,D-peptidoglycan transpeptidase YkuD (ErfK/YbiS/YcfS/YnhG family)